MSLFFHSDMKSFHYLNATQFLGALNDNIFKLLVVYLFINIRPEEANTILSLAGAVFVLPFLLFSSGAGVFADRISKSTIIVCTKILELILMSLALIAVYLKSEFFCFFILFMMGAQSAVFSPSKYGIIPELVEEKKVSKANGSLTSFTYLAIICGTFLASLFTDITNKNFLLVTFLCTLIAIIGLLTSLKIVKTTSKNSQKKINPFFLYEIYQTLSFSKKILHLFPTILASAFFLFFGAYVQLNIIPYAMQSLHLSEVGGGYLFLITAVGIAIGALIAGKLSKDRVELGITCLAGFMLVIIFFLLSILSFSLPFVIILLILLGVFGGMFLIPLDSFIQVASPDKKRGQIIAASNFLSFTGVLLASLCLYLFNEKFGFTAAGSFSLIGLLTLFFHLIVSGKLSDYFLPYFSKHILKRFYEVAISGDRPKKGSIIVVQSRSKLALLLSFSFLEGGRIFFASKLFKKFPWFNGWVTAIKMVKPKGTPKTTLEALLQKINEQDRKEITYFFLILNNNLSKEEIISYCQEKIGYFSAATCFMEYKKKKKPFSFYYPFKFSEFIYSFKQL